MEANELKKILKAHQGWLFGGDAGKQACLEGANLEGAHLVRAKLEWAHLERAHLEWANLEGAHLERANLEGANLEGANLEGANLDYSCWPLWCGSLKTHVDRKIAAQLAYHFCRLICDDDFVRANQAALKNLANEFHRVDGCGRIE